MLKLTVFSISGSDLLSLAYSIAWGIIGTIFVEKIQSTNPLKLLLTVGFCGGLTTFSTFSAELFEMIQNQQFLHASIYVMISVIIGCVAVYFGGYCARFL